MPDLRPQPRNRPPSPAKSSPASPPSCSPLANPPPRVFQKAGGCARAKPGPLPSHPDHPSSREPGALPSCAS
eukprot:2684036-Rhodomonas_salina.1